jgi:hypothetical protein
MVSTMTAHWIDDDLATARAELRNAEVKLSALRAQRQRWENKYIEAESANERAQANLHRGRVTNRIVALEKTLPALRHQVNIAEEHPDMRHDESFATGMVPPHNGWTLRCFKTLTINGTVYGRGAEVTPDMLAQCLNAPALLSGGHIRWQPPSAAKPARPAPLPVEAKPITEPNYIEEARAGIRALAVKRGGVPLAACRDAPELHDLMERARGQLREVTRTVMTAGWGQKAQPTLVGPYTPRKIVEDFDSILYRAEPFEMTRVIDRQGRPLIVPTDEAPASNNNREGAAA